MLSLDEVEPFVGTAPRSKSEEIIKNGKIEDEQESNVATEELVRNAEVDVPLDGLRRNRIDRNKLSDWLYEHEFWSILRPGKAKAKFF